MWGNFGKCCKYRKDIVSCFYLMSQMFYVMYQCGVLSFFYRCASFILNGWKYLLHRKKSVAGIMIKFAIVHLYV